ncbi:MAG: VOC family protein [Acidobacteriota bacterium]
MQLEPYLFFEGRCDEAIAFYRQALDAEVTMLFRYKDSPQPQGMIPPGGEDKVMHANLRIGDATMMLSDGQCLGGAAFQGFALSLAVAGEAEAKRLFSALAEGGQLLMPLEKTFFSPCFGMVADKFGVSWMIIVPQEGLSAGTSPGS